MVSGIRGLNPLFFTCRKRGSFNWFYKTASQFLSHTYNNKWLTRLKIQRQKNDKQVYWLVKHLKISFFSMQFKKTIHNQWCAIVMLLRMLTVCETKAQLPFYKIFLILVFVNSRWHLLNQSIGGVHFCEINKHRLVCAWLNYRPKDYTSFKISRQRQISILRCRSHRQRVSERRAFLRSV